jgi:hypothetical protein
MHQLLSAMVYLEPNNGKGKSQYCKCMLMNLLLLHHHRQQDDCVWRLFRQDPGIFNEEVGETALSLLARDTECQVNKRQTIEQVNMAFQRSGLMPAVVSEVSMALTSSPSSKGEWRHTLDDDSEEVTTTVGFMKTLIARILDGSATQYSNTLNEWATEARIAAVPLSSPPLFTAIGTRAYLRKKMHNYATQQARPLVEKFPVLWNRSAAIAPVIPLPPPLGNVPAMNNLAPGHVDRESDDEDARDRIDSEGEGVGEVDEMMPAEMEQEEIGEEEEEEKKQAPVPMARQRSARKRKAKQTHQPKKKRARRRSTRVTRVSDSSDYEPAGDVLANYRPAYLSERPHRAASLRLRDPGVFLITQELQYRSLSESEV